ncbi:interferon-induced protein 44-like [Oryzias melastigma]|uniref:interferon-induced protein 44-like n=1 Tax=Oryzias melastigma TaxID=30732 RepID=UPI000CF82B14|nr:interferon-induced protein 44-like [Oryzias melastigma]
MDEKCTERLQFENPWRTVTWTPEERKKLMEKIKSYKHPKSSLFNARILVVGAVGAGKSSFFNSFKSVFRGHVTNQGMAGNLSGKSLTTQFCSFTVKPEPEGESLPLVICDTMGLEADEERGIHIDDITNVINGHVLEGYQFNPSVPLKRDAHGFRKNPKLKDKIHCVAYVVDATNVSIMPQNMEKKLKATRKTVNSSRVPQLVLLTKIDEACPLVKKNIRKVYKSTYIKELMQEASARVGVPLSCVVPVKNYSEELELDMNTDILLLHAVVQILRLLDDFFDEPRG